jgi:hypothetical protein
MKYIILLFLCAFILVKCSINNPSMIEAISGYYKYEIVNDKNETIDTLFTTAQFKIQNKDEYFVGTIDLIGNVLIKEGTIFGLFDIVEYDSTSLQIQKYTIFRNTFVTNEGWSIENEIGFEIGTLNVEYLCVSTDTTLSFHQKNNFKDIILIERRDFIDVGGFWEIRRYGFEKNGIIVFFSYQEKYEKSDVSFRKLRIILNEYIPASSISQFEYDNWISRNSRSAKNLFDYKLR